jgi:CheY-like chemotaxis protein
VEAPGLIVDEPLASLDPGHQIDVMELLAAEARAGALVIAVLHDLTLAARHCDRLLLIDGGELVADGPPADVLTPERLAAVYGVRALVGQHLGGRWWCRWSARETDPYLSHSCRIMGHDGPAHSGGGGRPADCRGDLPWAGRTGHAARHVENGALAIAACLAGGVEAVVLDRMLPDMSGIDVMDRLRAAGQLPPVLMLSALGSVQDRVEGLKAGADDYLTKPFDHAELDARLAAICRRGRRGGAEEAAIWRWAACGSTARRIAPCWARRALISTASSSRCWPS